MNHSHPIQASPSGTFFGIRAAALALALVFAAPAAALAADAASFQTLPLGSAAPGFSATNLAGEPFDLQQSLKERNIVLFFWSLFCSPCREEMPLLQKVYPEYLEKGVEFVGVNLDEPALHGAIKNFLKGQKFSYPIIVSKTAAADAQTDKLYLITGTPAMYMIRKDGTIAYAHVGRLEIEDFKKAVDTNLLSTN